MLKVPRLILRSVAPEHIVVTQLCQLCPSAKGRREIPLDSLSRVIFHPKASSVLKEALGI